MSQRERFERALLQPEVILVVLWRRRNEFLVGVALRLTRLVTGVATIGVAKLMLIVRKKYGEVGPKISPFCGSQKQFAQTRKWKPRSVARAGFYVAIRTDSRRRSFARKEFTAMTANTRLVIRKLRNVRKGFVLANSLPVRRGKHVTIATFAFVFLSEVREPRIIDPRLRSRRSDWPKGHEKTQEA